MNVHSGLGLLGGPGAPGRVGGQEAITRYRRLNVPGGARPAQPRVTCDC